MSINISDKQLSDKYENYFVDINRIKQEIKQAKKNNTKATGNDTVDISNDGRYALENKMSALCRPEQSKDVRKLSPVSSYSIMIDFEKSVSDLKEEGIKNNTFDCHVNQMVSAYNHMQDDIEKKYADTNMEQQFYVDDDGSIQELTKEKELEMLDKAYEKHSKFMATTTEIWLNLQGFKPQTTYNSKDAGTVQSISVDDTEKSRITKQAYQAFMSAVNDDNIRLLQQSKESLKNIKLSLSISDTARNELNSIWDYYAKMK